MTDAATLQRIEALALGGQPERALDLAREALARAPDDPRLNAITGTLGAQLGHPAEAEALLRKAFEATGNAEVRLNLAIVLRQLGKLEDAIAHLEDLNAQGHGTDLMTLALANAYDNAGRTEEALKTVERIDVPGSEAHYNRATFLYKLHRFNDALAAFEAWQGPPDFSFHYNRALALIELGRFTDAARDLEAGLALNPGEANARWHLALCRLHLGDYAKAWPEYQARYAATDLPRHRGAHPPETGALNGRHVFVYAEQGAGDEMLFSRMVPDLIARAGAVTWECDTRLTHLFAYRYPGAAFVARGAGSNEERRADTRITAPDLGLLLGFDPTNALERRPKDPNEAPSMGLQGRSRPRIGVSLFTPGSHAWKRMAPAQHWREILTRPDTEVLGLDAPSPEFTAWAGDVAPPALEGFDPGADFAKTVERLAPLDAIVTIDNTLANLAGFAGLPAVVLLSRSPDWRWGPSAATSPWYPALTLARQDAEGSWNPAFEAAMDFIDNRLARRPEP
jgi:tetratricopeptide (TPR) repeat protein